MMRKPQAVVGCALITGMLDPLLKTLHSVQQYRFSAQFIFHRLPGFILYS